MSAELQRIQDIPNPTKLDLLALRAELITKGSLNWKKITPKSQFSVHKTPDMEGSPFLVRKGQEVTVIQAVPHNGNLRLKVRLDNGKEGFIYTQFKGGETTFKLVDTAVVTPRRVIERTTENPVDLWSIAALLGLPPKSNKIDIERAIQALTLKLNVALTAKDSDGVKAGLMELTKLFPDITDVNTLTVPDIIRILTEKITTLKAIPQTPDTSNLTRQIGELSAKVATLDQKIKTLEQTEKEFASFQSALDQTIEIAKWSETKAEKLDKVRKVVGFGTFSAENQARLLSIIESIPEAEEKTQTNEWLKTYGVVNVITNSAWKIIIMIDIEGEEEEIFRVEWNAKITAVEDGDPLVKITTEKWVTFINKESGVWFNTPKTGNALFEPVPSNPGVFIRFEEDKAYQIVISEDSDYDEMLTEYQIVPENQLFNADITVLKDSEGKLSIFNKKTKEFISVTSSKGDEVDLFTEIKKDGENIEVTIQWEDGTLEKFKFNANGEEIIEKKAIWKVWALTFYKKGDVYFLIQDSKPTEEVSLKLLTWVDGHTILVWPVSTYIIEDNSTNPAIILNDINDIETIKKVDNTFIITRKSGDIEIYDLDGNKTKTLLRFKINEWAEETFELLKKIRWYNLVKQGEKFFLIPSNATAENFNVGKIELWVKPDAGDLYEVSEAWSVSFIIVQIWGKFKFLKLPTPPTTEKEFMSFWGTQEFDTKPTINSGSKEITIGQKKYSFDGTEIVPAPKVIEWVPVPGEVIERVTTLKKWDSIPWVDGFTLTRDEIAGNRLITTNKEWVVKVFEKEGTSFKEFTQKTTLVWGYSSIVLWEKSNILVDKDNKLVTITFDSTELPAFNIIEAFWNFISLEISWADGVSFILDTTTWKKYEKIGEKETKAKDKKFLVLKSQGENSDYSVLRKEKDTATIETEVKDDEGIKKAIGIKGTVGNKRIIVTKESGVAAIVVLNNTTGQLEDVIKLDLVALSTGKWLIGDSYAILESIDGRKGIGKKEGFEELKTKNTTEFFTTLWEREIDSIEEVSNTKRLYKISIKGTSPQQFAIFDTLTWDIIKFDGLWVVVSGDIKVESEKITLASKQYTLEGKDTSAPTEEVIVDISWTKITKTGNDYFYQGTDKSKTPIKGEFLETVKDGDGSYIRFMIDGESTVFSLKWKKFLESLTEDIVKFKGNETFVRVLEVVWNRPEGTENIQFFSTGSGDARTILARNGNTELVAEEAGLTPEFSTLIPWKKVTIELDRGNIKNILVVDAK